MNWMGHSLLIFISIKLLNDSLKMQIALHIYIQICLQKQLQFLSTKQVQPYTHTHRHTNKHVRQEQTKLFS